MFNSVREAVESFCYLFMKEDIVIMRKGVAKKVLVRYAVKSVKDYTEEQEQQVYPVITLYNRYYQPAEVGGMAGKFLYEDAFASDPDFPDVLDMAKKYYEPIYLTFFFDIGLAADTHEESFALQDYIVKNIQYNFQLKLTKPLDVDQVPVYANYRGQMVSVPRRDGIFEHNFDLQFDAWIYPLVPEDVPVITTINKTVNIIPVPED